jgi:hypothetical protein
MRPQQTIRLTFGCDFAAGAGRLGSAGAAEVVVVAPTATFSCPLAAARASASLFSLRRWFFRAALDCVGNAR